MYMSDCLSRASVKDRTNTVLTQECEKYNDALLSNLPCTDRRLDSIKDAQHDEICLKLMQYTQGGWPNISDVPAVMKPYHQFRDELSVCNILLKGDRLIPTCQKIEMLELLHVCRLGILKCQQRAQLSVCGQDCPSK